MNPQVLMIAAISTTSVLVMASIVLFILIFKAKSEAKRTLAVALQMEKEIEQLSLDLDKASKRDNDAARRIAWLEARAKTGAASDSEMPTDATAASSDITNSAKPSITERRHRVLSLARRGLDSKDISSTLGVPHGEVDLIIGLSKVAA